MLTILFHHACFFFFYSLLSHIAVISQTFNPIAKLVMPIEIPTKEAKSEIETHLVIVEAKVRKCLMKFRVAQTLLVIFTL